jgi:hypothetical protein
MLGQWRRMPGQWRQMPAGSIEKQQQRRRDEIFKKSNGELAPIAGKGGAMVSTGWASTAGERQCDDICAVEPEVGPRRPAFGCRGPVWRAQCRGERVPTARSRHCRVLHKKIIPPPGLLCNSRGARQHELD